MNYFVALHCLFLIVELAGAGTTPDPLLGKVDQTANSEDHLLPTSRDSFYGSNDEEIVNRLKKGNLRGRISFEELGINDEREAILFCGSVMNELNSDILSGWENCECRVSWLKFININCDGRVCLDEVFDFSSTEANSTAAFPLFNSTQTALNQLHNICVHTSYGGSVYVPFHRLRSTACNAAVEIGINIPWLPGLPDSIVINLPEVCATARHTKFDYSTLNKCGVSIGGFGCECSVCESGRDVTIDCSDALFFLSLGFLSRFIRFECVPIGLLGLGGRTFINPILLEILKFSRNGGV